MMSFLYTVERGLKPTGRLNRFQSQFTFFFNEKVTLIRGLTRTVVECEQTGLEGMARDI